MDGLIMWVIEFLLFGFLINCEIIDESILFGN